MTTYACQSATDILLVAPSGSIFFSYLSSSSTSLGGTRYPAWESLRSSTSASSPRARRSSSRSVRASHSIHLFGANLHLPIGYDEVCLIADDKHLLFHIIRFASAERPRPRLLLSRNRARRHRAPQACRLSERLPRRAPRRCTAPGQCTYVRDRPAHTSGSSVW